MKLGQCVEGCPIVWSGEDSVSMVLVMLTPDFVYLFRFTV